MMHRPLSALLLCTCHFGCSAAVGSSIGPFSLETCVIVQSDRTIGRDGKVVTMLVEEVN